MANPFQIDYIRSLESKHVQGKRVEGRRLVLFQCKPYINFQVAHYSIAWDPNAAKDVRRTATCNSAYW